MAGNNQSQRKRSKAVTVDTSADAPPQNPGKKNNAGASGADTAGNRKSSFAPPSTTLSSFTQSNGETYHRPDQPAPVVPRTTARDFPPPPLPVRKPALTDARSHSTPAGDDDPTQPLLFEVAWEVCWQLGGIYTVMRTKASTMVESWGNRYYLIGPYNADTASVEFEPAEPEGAIAEAIRRLEEMSIRVHYGYWLIDGRRHDPD